MHKELPTPGAAKAGKQSIEVLRVWLVDGVSNVSLLPMIFDDPAVWGILLADAAQQVVHARGEIGGDDRRETLARILAAFQRELTAPTKDHTGGVVEKPGPGEPEEPS